MSGSEDSDGFTSANILSQFTAVNVGQPRKSNRPRVEVNVPFIENHEQYEYLPGHSNVRYVISQVHGEKAYKVRFESGDIEKVRSKS